MVKLLGMKFTKKTTEECASMICEWMEENQKTKHIITANPEMVMRARREAEFKSIVAEADLVTPDGIGVVIASRIRKEPLRERVAGIDLIETLLTLRETRKMETRVYLLGAKEPVTEKAAAALKERYSYVRLVGSHHGFFGANEERGIVEDIATASPHLLLVALGSPKQEAFISAYKKEWQPLVAIGCGGTLDVLAGEVKRAPLWVQRMGCEWLFRLGQNPSRWRRQLDLFRFLFLVVTRRHSS
ncbi:WecB/TagA/CpsF family glycosyltransferase (plasmid) [Pontibacillus sp. ALD_SL1]|uniref:WecB/TagA/CpsF family glycosyltransferase n=1 Tax=Pontibacillus sp. ALD_SL1 TaxID=2777185 RepID=UPI001A95CE85|nr:WecB/TagA/CpsF family glycosyltransferase [Pontibacillus sp. ALD_SL1]QST02732.1 WecB/TagA/CpsF family glycosyltransferase [Pontibacillus sp. ALD_SL1]